MKTNMQLIEKILKKRIILCCGPGGVGKTTLAATLGIEASKHKKKTLVITIDPAKRLATSLGIKAFSNEVQWINDNLAAFMLDAKETFDQIIAKYSPDPETTERILNNAIYKHLSGMVAGTHEYMAMEQLYEFYNSHDFDLIIVDTPPSSHAVDFLDAPEKMQQQMGNSRVKYLTKPSLFSSASPFEALTGIAQKIFKTLDKIIGLSFLKDLSILFESTSELLKGFEERAEKIDTILSNQQSSFIVISSPNALNLRESQKFIAALEKKEFELLSIILNRVTPQASIKNEVETKSEILNFYRALNQREKENIDKFSEALPSELKASLVRIPQFKSDIHGMKSLEKLSQFIR